MDVPSQAKPQPRRRDLPSLRGKMEVIALVQDPESIARCFRHLGLPTEEPAIAPARGPLTGHGNPGRVPMPSRDASLLAKPAGSARDGRAASCAAAMASRLTRPRRSRGSGPPLPSPPRHRTAFPGGKAFVCPETQNRSGRARVRWQNPPWGFSRMPPRTPTLSLGRRWTRRSPRPGAFLSTTAQIVVQSRSWS